MKSYLINLHSHSFFSDGVNSPYVMAVEAKRLGFSALVITDHFYGQESPFSINTELFRKLKGACLEAKKILPVILGLEIPFMGQEVLVFGGAAIKEIITQGKPSMEEMLRLKAETGCAVILCHPGGYDFRLSLPVLDGYERFNSGIDYFQNNKSFYGIENLPAWCNSDAHRVEDLQVGYNQIGKKIQNEGDLIRYIKKGHQPTFVLKKEIKS
jgi:predicted metal-dependent phosphoesterase TrpH